METNIISILAHLPDEPIISNEDEKIIKSITKIKKTSEFEPMNLTEERLDQLITSLDAKGEFGKEITGIIKGISRVPAIILHEAMDDDDEEDYI